MKAYVTFGQAHTHSVNGITFDKDSIAVVEAPTYSDCRTLVFDLFGDKWHNCYYEAYWKKHHEEILPLFPRGLIHVDGGAE